MNRPKSNDSPLDPAGRSSPDQLRNALAARAVHAPDEASIRDALADAASSSRRRNRRWATSAAAAAVITIAVVGTLITINRASDQDATPGGPTINGTGTAQAAAGSTKPGSTYSGPASAETATEPIPVQRIQFVNTDPTLCANPVSAVVRMARRGSSPMVTWPTAIPSSGVGSNLMFVAGSDLADGIFCVRSPSGTVSASSPARPSKQLTYLARTSGSDYTYAGAVGPTISRIEIQPNRLGTAIGPEPLIGDPAEPLNSLGMFPLGGGWRAFNIPIFSSSWDGTLVAYDAQGRVVERVYLP